jgi:hypothetical protein
MFYRVQELELSLLYLKIWLIRHGFSRLSQRQTITNGLSNLLGLESFVPMLLSSNSLKRSGTTKKLLLEKP